MRMQQYNINHFYANDFIEGLVCPPSNDPLYGAYIGKWELAAFRSAPTTIVDAMRSRYEGKEAFMTSFLKACIGQDLEGRSGPFLASMDAGDDLTQILDSAPVEVLNVLAPTFVMQGVCHKFGDKMYQIENSDALMAVYEQFRRRPSQSCEASFKYAIETLCQTSPLPDLVYYKQPVDYIMAANVTNLDAEMAAHPDSDLTSDDVQKLFPEYENQLITSMTPFYHFYHKVAPERVVVVDGEALQTTWMEAIERTPLARGERLGLPLTELYKRYVSANQSPLDISWQEYLERVDVQDPMTFWQYVDRLYASKPLFSAVLDTILGRRTSPRTEQLTKLLSVSREQFLDLVVTPFFQKSFKALCKEGISSFRHLMDLFEHDDLNVFNLPLEERQAYLRHAYDEYVKVPHPDVLNAPRRRMRDEMPEVTGSARRRLNFD